MSLSKENESGQALLLVLLLLAVVLTLSLSFVSRSITEVGISTYEDESVRALNAAEAGVESVILNLNSITPGVFVDDTFDNQSSYRSQILLDMPTASDEYAYPLSLKSGQTAFFWFVSHNEDGDPACTSNSGTNLACSTANNLRLCFGNPGTSGNGNIDAPAVEVSLYYDRNANNAAQNVVNAGNYSGVRVSTKYFDPNNLRRTNDGTNAAQAKIQSCTLDSKDFAFMAAPALGQPNISIVQNPVGANNAYSMYVPCRNVRGCMLGLSVRFLYNTVAAHSAAIKTFSTGGNDVPSQGYLVSSTGYSGDSVRKIEAYQAYPLPPEFATGALFVEGGIVK